MANIRTVDYKGFNYATGSDGTPGIMMWSGSIELSASAATLTSYTGVGMELIAHSASYMRFRSNPNELDIRTDKFYLGSNSQYISGSDGNIEISSSNFHLSNGGDVVMQGTITAEAGGTIGGWDVGSTFISSSNLILSSSGTIQTVDFQSSEFGTGKGYRLGPDGIAEFEEARIRGTLSTTVFEKETVSAVGGQLIISNATAIKSGSELHSTGLTAGEDEQQITVDNPTGFEVDEYVLAKATSSTGFIEEVMKISAIETDYIEFIRGMNEVMIPTMSSGQTLVSLGKSGTGYIHMNATSGSDTPYMDIVERTGSGVDDLDLKARVGDLSGIEDGNFSDGVTGHGIYTTNGYFKGKLEVGSVPSQPPVDKLLLHYNFSQATSSGYILDQTPNLYSASISDNFAGEVKYDLSYPGMVTGSFVAHVTRSIFEPFTSSLSQSKNSFSAGYRFRHLDGNVDRNFFLAKGHGSFVVYKQTNNAVQLRLNTGSAGNNYVAFSTTADTVLPNHTYQVFITAKENDKAELYLYSVDSGSLVEYVTGSLAGKHFVFKKHMGSSYTNMDHGIAGWGGAPDDCQFSGSMFDIRYYNQHVLTEAECHAIMQNPDSTTGGTIIDGNSIATGKIQSNNYGTAVGSEIDLDLGTMTMGGTAAPGFQIDANGLVQAVNFAEKLTTVNADNLSVYRTVSGDGYNLVFDGSQGGEVTMNMALYTDPGLIKGILLPQSGVELNAKVNIYPKVEGIRFDDGTVAVSGNQASK